MFSGLFLCGVFLWLVFDVIWLVFAVGGGLLLGEFGLELARSCCVCCWYY